ncbi:bifunctional riboflavin kinase/FAD synthetase [Legionella sp. km772]|uniref:bifunctional riboflavin kinase/FAD synthetase n=1 Tax=Legionella sp. km772 TaxID=2498111 RepID=UPI000F8DABCC|nr:bifunctional riboflavin kinase/FAD synthetase [Legionella sp. km772]RUR08702.1 bifunctional riboflavin kinase/FAD synthetase [Legionella sp. km772]
MKLVRDLKYFSNLNQDVVATIGNFDGVHLGHQSLLKLLRKKADSLNLPLVLILFEPQPKEYFQKEQAPARLSTLREKLNALKGCKIDYIYCIRFNSQLAQTLAKDFIYHLFNSLRTRYLFVGQDFRFGKNREGDVALLQKLSADYHCEIEIYPDYLIHDERVSSTRIRLALQRGDLHHAALLLGRSYSMCGRVIKGDGRGRQWGIPTANIGLHRLALPLKGVFVVQVLLNKKIIYGVANIGKRPTVDGTKNILEVHLLDFNESIYGDIVEVFFLHKLRDEVKFTSVDALIGQIHQDIAEARAYLDLNTANI